MFSTLLSSTIAFLRAHGRIFLLSIALLGTLMAVEQWFAFGRILSSASEHLNTPSLDPAALEGLPDAEREALVWGQAMKAFQSSIPALVFHALAYWFLALAGMLAFYILALEPPAGAFPWRRVADLFFPFLGVQLWTFLRTFAWIPFLGIIPLIILGPRFVFAPVILIRENAGVRASVQRSYERTKGQWLRIVGNLVGAVVVAFIASWILRVLLGIATAISSDLFWLEVWLNALIHAATFAFMTVFVAQLAGKVMAAGAPASVKKTKAK